MPPPVRIELVSKMADIEHRLAYGTNDRLQLGALCGAFAGELLVEASSRGLRIGLLTSPLLSLQKPRKASWLLQPEQHVPRWR